MPQPSLTAFSDGPLWTRQRRPTSSRTVRERTATADTGCACPECHQNIAGTHGDQFLSRATVARDAIRAALAGVAVRVNGWACQPCGVVVPRDMESPNTCWSTRTNSDARFVGVLVERDRGADAIVAPVDRRCFREGLPPTFSRRCPACGQEHGGCVTQTAVPCRPCRGGRAHRRWTKPWDDGGGRTEP